MNLKYIFQANIAKLSFYISGESIIVASIIDPSSGENKETFYIMLYTKVNSKQVKTQKSKKKKTFENSVEDNLSNLVDDGRDCVKQNRIQTYKNGFYEKINYRQESTDGDAWGKSFAHVLEAKD